MCFCVAAKDFSGVCAFGTLSRWNSLTSSGGMNVTCAECLYARMRMKADCMNNCLLDSIYPRDIGCSMSMKWLKLFG